MLHKRIKLFFTDRSIHKFNLKNILNKFHLTIDII
nr:MAG TPA: hypothetical protein [Caudoviricetes sp.]